MRPTRETSVRSVTRERPFWCASWSAHVETGLQATEMVPLECAWLTWFYPPPRVVPQNCVERGLPMAMGSRGFRF